jgi:hypothetical protein
MVAFWHGNWSHKLVGGFAVHDFDEIWCVALFLGIVPDGDGRVAQKML